MFHWLTGDRFACYSAKDRLIARYKKDKVWNVRNLDTIEDPNEFCARINASELFGTNNFIYIHDGPVPDPIKVSTFIEKLPDNKVLIVIEGSIDKRNKMYKTFGSKITEYPLVKNEKGYLNKDSIPMAKKVIKSLSEWSGSEEVFDQIFFACDYDYGKTVNEIKKLITYNDGNPPTSIDDVKDIICINESPDIEKLKSSLNEKDVKNSLSICSDILNDADIDNYILLIVSALLENYTFLFYIRKAIEDGAKSESDISSYVAENWQKFGMKQDYGVISRRLYFYRKHIPKFTTSFLANALTKLNETFENAMFKRYSNQYLLNNLVWELTR